MEDNKGIVFIQEAFQKIDVTITEQQAQQFYDYYSYLVKKNEVMNLTAIIDFEEVVSKHFIDSAMLREIRILKDGEALIDVGTGAGFPGIPLKILYPGIRVVLLDSLNKRVQFLKEVIELLHLEEIQAIHGRAEDYAKKQEYREQFDICVSRAVANLSSLSEYCLPFEKCGGSFISYKSGKVREELETAYKAISILGGRLAQRKNFELPNTDASRCLLDIVKEKSTPRKYPRKAGLPGKEPIF